jgi:hypothetical protein
MALFSDTKDSNRHIDRVGDSSVLPDAHRPSSNENTPIRTLRRFQSQPQMNSEKRRRHFSFEPGEDYLQALQEASSPNAADRQVREPCLTGASTPALQSRKDVASPCEGISPETQSLSKIPTPVQPFGSLRRETSVSSLGSVLTKSTDGRHHSQSSILTAFRDHQSGKLRPASSSRSSSYHNLNGADSSPGTRNSVTGLRGDHANQATSLGGSPAKTLTRAPKVPSSIRKNRQMTAPGALENEAPGKID